MSGESCYRYITTTEVFRAITSWIRVEAECGVNFSAYALDLPLVYTLLYRSEGGKTHGKDHRHISRVRVVVEGDRKGRKRRNGPHSIAGFRVKTIEKRSMEKFYAVCHIERDKY